MGPADLAGSGETSAADPVLRLRIPISITYDWSAGPNATAHLDGLLDGRFVGRRCPRCTLVYLPPRNGVCPRCAVSLGEVVECGPRGTVTTFCVVNVPFLGQQVPIPYVAAQIRLDGADLSFGHLIQECDASAVRIGMRVEPVWKPRDQWGPTLENVAHFRPTGEPDTKVTDAS